MNVFTLVAEARRINSYHKLPKDAMPPKSIWHSYKKCNKWIEDHQTGGKEQGQSGMLDIEDWEQE